MKRKILSWIITTALFFMLFCFIPMGVSAADFPYGITATDQYPFYDGDGTMDDPYLISTPQQLAQLAYNVDQGYDYQNKYIKVIANLDLAGLDWVPVGTSATEEFRGNFDGNNKVISNLTIGSLETPNDAEELGLFGYLSSAEIHNVIIENAAIYSSIPDYYGDFGVLAGEVSSGIISFCSTSGFISVSSNSGSYVGGLVGSMDSGTNSLLVGCNSSVNVNVSSSYASKAGGLIGDVGCSVIGCSASGTVAGSGDLGGIAGYSSSEMINCYATGIISGNNMSGGLVGYNEGTIKNCYANGAVYGQEYAGGLVGYNNYYDQVINSYATGNVSVFSLTRYAGGLIGSCSGDIINCYAAGQVTYGAGLVDSLFAGIPASVVSNSFWNSDLNATGGAGTGKTETELQSTDFLALLNDPTLASRDETYREWLFVSGINNDMPVLSDVGVGTDDSLPVISNTDSTHNLADEAKISFTSSSLGQCYYAFVVPGSEIPVIDTSGSGVLCLEGINEYSIPASSGAWDIYVVIKDMNDLVSTTEKIELAAEPSLFAGGSGTSVDPYQIATPYHLYNVRYNLDCYFIVTADIDLDPTLIGDEFWYDEVVGWRALGGSDYLEATFSGDFNGNGKTISNLSIGSSGDPQDEYDYSGLFGYVNESGKIYNLGVIDLEIYSNTATAGGVAASSYGEIDHCYASGSIKVNSNGGVGGIAGNNYSNAVIKNCWSDVTIHGYGSNVGGFVGFNNGYIYNSGATGNVNGGSWSHTGGFVGDNISYHNVASCENCYATGDVSGTGAGYVGAFYGCNDGASSFIDCYYNENATVDAIFDMGYTPTIASDLDGMHSVLSTNMQSTDFVDTLNEGIPDTTGYYSWTLTSGLNNDYPILSETLPDFTAPSVNDSEIGSSNITESSVVLSWTGASDNVTNGQNLLYRLYQCNSDDLDTVTDIETNGSPVTDFGGIQTYTVTGLDASTTYYFNIIVKDEAGNKSAYSTKSVTTVEPAEEPYPSEKFTDVDMSSGYRESIDFVVENGLFYGTSDTTFSPNDYMTRAMLVTVLWRLEGEPTSNAVNPFTDVIADKWYTTAVIWESENDIVAGYDDDTFGTNDPVTRQQMAAILYRYATYKEYDVSVSDSLSAFTDAGQVSDWASSAIKWAVAEELIYGIDDTTLNPRGKATRVQVAMILMRFVRNYEK